MVKELETTRLELLDTQTKLELETRKRKRKQASDTSDAHALIRNFAKKYTFCYQLWTPSYLTESVYVAIKLPLGYNPSTRHVAPSESETEEQAIKRCIHGIFWEIQSNVPESLQDTASTGTFFKAV